MGDLSKGNATPHSSMRCNLDSLTSNLRPQVCGLFFGVRFIRHEVTLDVGAEVEAHGTPERQFLWGVSLALKFGDRFRSEDLTTLFLAL